MRYCHIMIIGLIIHIHESTNSFCQGITIIFISGKKSCNSRNTEQLDPVTYLKGVHAKHLEKLHKLSHYKRHAHIILCTGSVDCYIVERLTYCFCILKSEQYMDSIDKVSLRIFELFTQYLAIAPAQICICLTSGIVYALKYLKLPLIESFNLLVHAVIIHQHNIFGINGDLKVLITYKLYQRHRFIVPLNLISVGDSPDGILITATAEYQIMGQSIVVLMSLQLTYEFLVRGNLIKGYIEHIIPAVVDSLIIQNHTVEH